MKGALIHTNCGITDRNLTGTFLIEYHNCSITVNHSKFTNIELIRSEQPFLIPLVGLKIYTENLEPETELAEMAITNRHHIDNITQKHKIQSYTSLGLSSVSMIIAVSVIVCLLKRKKVQIEINTGKILARRSKNEATRTPNRDVSDSKEGAVKGCPDHLNQLLEILQQRREVIQSQLHALEQQQQQK